MSAGRIFFSGTGWPDLFNLELEHVRAEARGDALERDAGGVAPELLEEVDHFVPDPWPFDDDPPDPL